MKIILVRHGETVENVKGIRQGHSHGTLSKKGMKQARLLAKELKKYKIDAIYSSDLGRAANTARIIKRSHKAALLILTKAMRERNPGIYNLTPMDEEKRAREASDMPRHKWRPPKGESWEDVQKRAGKFLAMLKKKYKNSTILLVGHGRVNSIIISMLLKKPLGISADFHPKNATISILEIGKSGKAKMKLFDYGVHLE